MKKLVQKLNGVDLDSRKIIEELDIVRGIITSQFPVVY